MSGTLALQRPIIQIDGVELSSAQLNAFVDLQVEIGVRSIGRACLRFSDPGYALSAHATFARLESAVKIKDTASGTYFDGEIVERAVFHSEDEGTVLELVALDRARRLTSATVVEARQNQNLSDALTSLLATHGMRGSITGASAKFTWTAVTGTALAVIDEVAGRYGSDWIVQAETLHLWDAASGTPRGADSARLRLGADLTEFGVRVGTGRNREVTVRGWDGPKQQALVGRATAAKDRNVSDFLPKEASPVKVQRSDLVPQEAADADALARAAARGSRSIARGRGPLNAAITPGMNLEVTDAGVSSGTYYVREVEHILTANGGWTRFVAGDRDAPRLVDPWAQPSGHSTFTHHSALIGIVTRVDDAGPRVKVKLPVIGEQFESTWARVLMLGAGESTGLFVMPEINDEVLVLFPDGDLRQPVVVGGLHGESRMPSSRATTRTSDKAVEARAWSSKQQHYVELADGKSPQRQHVKLGLGNGDQYVRVGKDKVEISAPTDVPIRIGNANAWIEIGTDGSITLSGKAVKVEANGEITLGGMSIKASSKTSVDVEARTTLSMKASGSAALESMGPTKVKGATVLIN